MTVSVRALWRNRPIENIIDTHTCVRLMSRNLLTWSLGLASLKLTGWVGSASLGEQS